MDELDDLLTPGPLPPESPDRRAAIWRQSQRILRWRRWVWCGRRLALLVACYVAGMATLWCWRDRPAPPREHERPIETTPASPAPPAPSIADEDPYRYDPPHVLERWAALAEGRRRVELYRRAGDLYYERFGDHAAAIRCYRRALDSGTAADLVVEADKDNWLLMSLKVARLKEKRDARN